MSDLSPLTMMFLLLCLVMMTPVWVLSSAHWTTMLRALNHLNPCLLVKQPFDWKLIQDMGTQIDEC